MKIFFLKTGIILLISLLIMASGGFSVYQHICHCAGELSASIFMEAGCAHETEAKACCSGMDNHSCCMEKEAETSGKSCHKGDCCETSSYFLKINDSYQPGPAKLSLKPLLISSAALFIYTEEIVQPVYIFNSYRSDLPPPDSGRQILVAHHQLKLDPPQV